MTFAPPFLHPLFEAGFRAGWVGRIPAVKTAVARHEAVARLRPYHQRALHTLNGSMSSTWRCEQVHQATVQVVAGEAADRIVPNTDGLICQVPGTLMGIYVADCAAVYIGDPVQRVAALLHSGKKGTELRIVDRAVTVMKEAFESNPQDLIIVVSPCIRPPVYEVDFAAQIREQSLRAGVSPENYHDAGLCTASEPAAFYSYRAERGLTGRMFAMMGV